jgi:hypothetical protein
VDRRFIWLAVGLIVAALALVLYPRRTPEPPVIPVELPEPAPATESAPAFLDDPDPEPAPAFVEEAPEPLEPLPALNESDPVARAALAAAAGEALVERHLVPNDLVRKLVATVDNLPREALWINARVVPPLYDRFRVEGADETLALSPANFARYAAFFRLVEAIDTAALAEAYQRHYPLLQQAYEELGYPGRQFHSRALEVIDHLLATPRVEGTIRLSQPHVLYLFSDPALEALSPGQKILLRVGPQNAAIARAKLIELRAALEQLSGTTGTSE